MTAAPIPALAQDHYSPRASRRHVSARAPVVRRSQNGYPSVRRFIPRSALADRLDCPTTPADFRAPPNARPRGGGLSECA